MLGQQLDLTTLENWLWEAACKIRGPVDAPKFKSPVRFTPDRAFSLFAVTPHHRLQARFQNTPFGNSLNYYYEPSQKRECPSHDSPSA